MRTEVAPLAFHSSLEESPSVIWLGLAEICTVGFAAVTVARRRGGVLALSALAAGAGGATSACTEVGGLGTERRGSLRLR